MPIVKQFQPGEIITAARLNESVASAIEAHSKGLPVAAEPEQSSGPHPDDERKALAAVHATADTDAWDIINAHDSAHADYQKGAEIVVLTDVQYDSATFQLAYRGRTLSFDSGGRLVSVSAETALVQSVQFEKCPTCTVVE